MAIFFADPKLWRLKVFLLPSAKKELRTTKRFSEFEQVSAALE